MYQVMSFSLPQLTTKRGRLIIGAMEYVSVEEASEITGYSIQYLRRLLRLGRIEATKKASVWWINLDSLKAYKQEMDTLGKEKFSPHRDD